MKDLIEKLEALKDGLTKTTYTDWNMAIGRCIQIVRQHQPTIPADLSERIQAMKAFTSNRPADYCHMFYNAVKLIEEMEGYMGDARKGAVEPDLSSDDSSAPTPSSASHNQGEMLDNAAKNDEYLLKKMVNAYAEDQFENQQDNIGCCADSMRAALKTIRPYLQPTEPVSLEDMAARLWLHRNDGYPLWEAKASIRPKTVREVKRAYLDVKFVLEAAGVKYAD